MADELDVIAPDESPPLSGKERAFVDAYLGPANFNATKACRIAGYHQVPEALWVTASRMLRSAKVQAAIRARTGRLAMQADELLDRLGEDARLDLAAFKECFVEIDGRRVLDWNEVEARGLGVFIKAVRPTKYGDSLELIDTQRAKEMIGRALGLFADRLRVEGQIDYSKLTDDELRQLAAGKRPSTL